MHLSNILSQIFVNLTLGTQIVQFHQMRGMIHQILLLCQQDLFWALNMHCMIIKSVSHLPQPGHILDRFFHLMVYLGISQLRFLVVEYHIGIVRTLIYDIHLYLETNILQGSYHIYRDCSNVIFVICICFNPSY